LGCGERYLDGYVNVDFPAEHHTVQSHRVADVLADLRGLRYGTGTVEEVRLHHVFEHFPRHIACALVACWSSWLRQDGALRIEVPDFFRTGVAALNPFAGWRARGVALRHLFGSHEADWAAHREAYTKGRLARLVSGYGLQVVQVERNHWRGTYNFELTARKARALDKAASADATRTYLSEFLVDSSTTEERLLEVWMAHYALQVENCWADG
jgi:hypothetical protein